MIGDKDPIGGLVASAIMVVWCPLVFISAQKILTTSSSSSSTIRRVSDYVHGMSSSVHNRIWRCVCQQTSSSSSNNNDARTSTLDEIMSPLGSLNNSTSSSR